MAILPLFASYVSSNILTEDTSALNHNRHEFKGASNHSQVSKDFRVLKKYPKIEKLLLKKFNEFAKDTLHFDNQDFALTTSWFTKVEKGQYGDFHNHKNCFYSGVYYYDEYSNNTSQIVFLSPVSNFSDFWIAPSKYVIQNSTDWSITPTKGLLLLFPSYLKHKVDINHEEDIRYSLAFNFVPIGEYGSEDSLYNTSWFR